MLQSPLTFQAGAMSLLTSQVATSEKTFYLIRHGITEMNEVLHRQPWGSPGFKDAGIWDTRLSTRGIAHAAAIHKQWKSRRDSCPIPWEEISTIVVSPLTRTMETLHLLTSHTSPSFLSSSTKIIAEPLMTERVYMSSDVGRPKSELEKEFPHVDFSRLSDDSRPWWYVHDKEVDGPYQEWRPDGEYCVPGEPDTQFKQRMRAFKESLLKEDGQHIVIVAHWGVLKALTGLEFDNCQVKKIMASQILPEPYVDVQK